VVKKNKSFPDQELYQTEFLEKYPSSILSSFSEIINLIISENADLDEIVDKVLNYILTLLNAAGGFVYIVDYQKKYLRLAHSVAVSQKVINPLKQMDFSEGLTGQVFKQKEIHFVENIYSNKNITQKVSHDLLKEFGVESYLGIPLLVGESCVGIISLVFTHHISPPNDYTKKILTSICGSLGGLIHKNQIEIRERKYYHQLSILRDLPSLWRSSKSFDELLCATALSLVETLNFWDLAFFHYIPEKGILKKVTFSGGLSDYVPEDYQQSIEDGVIGWALRERKTIYVPDIRKEEEFISIEGGTSLCELAIPVMVTDAIFGVINIESQELDSFDDIDIWTMETVAQNLALYLEYMQHTEQQKLRLKNLEIINKAIRFLNSTIELDELQHNFCKFLLDIPNVYYVSFYHYLPDKKKIKKISSAGGSETQRAINSIWSIDKGMIAWVIKNKKSLYVPDTSKDPIYLQVSEKDFGSEYCLPVMFGGELYGALNIESYKLHAFGDNQKIVIEAITDYYSKALNNAILFDQINKEKEKTEAILSQMNEGVVFVDEQNCVIYSNKAALKLFPQKHREASTWLPFYQTTKKELGDKSQISLENNLENKIIHVSAIRMNSTNDIGNILIVFNDVTKNKHFENERIKNEKMNLAVKMAGSVAHEINQPLTGILGFCSLLQEELHQKSELTENIKIIENQAIQISTLIKKFQNLVTIRTKPYVKETEIIDWEKSGVSE